MTSPLHPAIMVGFVATTDAARSRAFYEGQLGFRVVSDDGYGMMVEANGQTMRIQKLKTLTPQPFTVLGWNVDDLAATAARLAAAGVKGEHFPGVTQNADGIVDFPDGTRLMWMKDPDGNILSVAQMPR